MPVFHLQSGFEKSKRSIKFKTVTSVKKNNQKLLNRIFKGKSLFFSFFLWQKTFFLKQMINLYLIIKAFIIEM